MDKYLFNALLKYTFAVKMPSCKMSRMATDNRMMCSFIL